MTTRPSDRATTLTTPEALAVLDKAHGTFDNIRFERRHEKPDRSEYWTERIREVIEARAHLASRIAELEAELAAVLKAADYFARNFNGKNSDKLRAAIDAARGGE